MWLKLANELKCHWVERHAVDTCTKLCDCKHLFSSENRSEVSVLFIGATNLHTIPVSGWSETEWAQFSAQPMNVRLPYHEQAQRLLLSLPPAPAGMAAQAGREDSRTQSPISALARNTRGETQTWTQECRIDETSEVKMCTCGGVCTKQPGCTW